MKELPQYSAHVYKSMAIFALLSVAFAINAKTAEPFYEEKARGWFWYEDPVLKEEPEKEKPKKPAPTPDPAKAEAKEPEGPEPLSAEWLKINMVKYRDIAVDDPSEENVKRFLYLQKITMDKASEFSRQVAFVTQSDPTLDENTRNPVASYAKQTASREANAEQDRIIQQLADTAGMWFFYSSTCTYCIKMAPLLSAMSKRYGLEIKAIALDGQPLPGGYFPNYTVDRGQAEKLNISVTPSIFMVKPPEDIVPVTYGIVTMAELRKRIINGATYAGWIDRDSYSIANAVKNSPAIPKPGELDINENSPEALLQSLKDIYKQHE